MKSGVVASILIPHPPEQKITKITKKKKLGTRDLAIKKD
jgi:hypothetical protein